MDLCDRPIISATVAFCRCYCVHVSTIIHQELYLDVQSVLMVNVENCGNNFQTEFFYCKNQFYWHQHHYLMCCCNARATGYVSFSGCSKPRLPCSLCLYCKLAVFTTGKNDNPKYEHKGYVLSNSNIQADFSEPETESVCCNK